MTNDGFGDGWDGYLKANENASQVAEVLGVTVYLTIECYKAIKARKDVGRLPKVRMIFPNVEFRMTAVTDKLKVINLRLLFCPDDADYVDRIERALSGLAFEYKSNLYGCNLAELALL